MLLKAKILVKEIQEGHLSFLETPKQKMMTYKLEWLAGVLDMPILYTLAYMQGSLQPMIGSETRFASLAIIIRVNMTVLSLPKAKECQISYSLETSACPLNALTE
eukprot:3159513-Ditylum_brightwellii.AAC.1